ncbi:acyl-CoA carboxylase subunit beta [Allobranchiibius sp. GilTou73]|uniref:acyl-CoA carboxylase subunit beta n=1 Tax=Allobranchiibius sp. GilTou73 TaxID=2904523 RepID=UPI001F17B477|nr:carboxyl transferase domain-containing protein [Allobranchiibius sp. GilTou73]UIJ34258.1 acyl-CoA carboxylase subunit beta [Allobranchiibius sp. GilTou73]
MTSTDHAPAPAPVEEADPRDPLTRLTTFLDDGSLQLISAQDRSGMLAATGTVRGVPTVVFAADPRIQGGALGAEGCGVIVAAYERALADDSPIVGLWHSGGARLADGVVSLNGMGEMFAIMTRASGKIPQISVVLGAAAGGAAYGPALTDIVILGPDGLIFVTGPDVVRSVTGENVTAARLGGAEPHGRRSGVVHVATETTEEAYDRGRQMVSLLSDQGRMDVPSVQDRDLAATFPESAKRAYDVHPLIADVVDDVEDCVELHPRWAPSIVTTLGRLGGRTVGVIANNPLRLGGCLDATSAEKASRFVRMCDAFGIPLVVLVDVPGYLPGVGQEWDGVVRRGAKLLHAFAEAVVPRVTLVTRKTYGGAYIAMNSRSLGATRVFAWPTAEVAVMGHVAAVRILHRRRLAEVDPAERVTVENELAEEHAVLAGGLPRAVEIGVVDEVIESTSTRTALATAIAAAPQRRGEHGNIPL